MTKWDEWRNISCKALGKIMCNGMNAEVLFISSDSCLSQQDQVLYTLIYQNNHVAVHDLWIFIFIGYVYCRGPIFFFQFPNTALRCKLPGWCDNILLHSPGTSWTDLMCNSLIDLITSNFTLVLTLLGTSYLWGASSFVDVMTSSNNLPHFGTNNARHQLALRYKFPGWCHSILTSQF